MTRSTIYSLLVSGLMLTSQTTFAQADEKIINDTMNGSVSTIDGYVPSMSITEDGKTAYFSKGTYQKPLYGVFSKKELVYHVYRAEKVNGEWTNITQLQVCSKHYSAKHPTVTADGKRLFFASNMKGSFGKYDIYVTEIAADGSVGVSKNLGPKVNTKEDELYPSIYNETLLFFASEGRNGYGGLDLYASQVVKNTLTTSVNLGAHINSDSDEYAIQLSPEKKMGFVVSNRGFNNTVSQYTVAYGRSSKQKQYIDVASNNAGFETVLNDDTREYADTSFQDQQ
ncbi:hypothetical protein LCL86_10305 [Muricauda ruestringensis]|uniref:hypothetical protein n=1 Tax=Flagellimonas ruestringensis TaxID=111501 RepID=UPI001CD60512|nr:hypothetical protein [Allomuricauda ruestringensis]MCA0959435.1 hypothetical protein [Allomuricauda ruestringensis]